MDVALASEQSCFLPFKEFLWRHWNCPKTQFPDPYAYCDLMMWKRGLYGKPKHIFIHEPIEKIIKVCRGEGKHLGGGWYLSKRCFFITKCKFNHKFKCYTGSEWFEPIIIKCIYGFPVAIQE
ncbi:ribonuclease homolog [Mauremys mutica]|uniref:ribonuclease homolog n=1 Tax=Mauremys mutica TaxID=74926 RepID=UPI001D16B409|nr:ribonuclease homolog [Mauremys mutica]